MSSSGVDIQVVQVAASHVRAVARGMRSEDRNEVMASAGKSPVAALAMSIRKSSHCWTVMIDGKPAAIWGVADLNVLGGVVAVWLLGTDAIERHPGAFARRSVAFKDQLFTRYKIMRNVVDARNLVSIRWLKWLGAEFSDAFDIRGHAFMLFELRRGDV